MNDGCFLFRCAELLLNSDRLRSNALHFCAAIDVIIKEMQHKIVG